MWILKVWAVLYWCKGLPSILRMCLFDLSCLSATITGRMHAPGNGLSQSALPFCCSVPTWLKEQIYKLAEKGLTPSQIRVILRDSHSIA